jgi:allantoin racemase
MRILIVNPNSTESMTALIRDCARAIAGPGTVVDAVNPTSTPPSIQSHLDDARATPEVVRLVGQAEADGYDGAVIACFGDPGLYAAREVVDIPVVGIAEAAMRTAGFLGRTYSVVTTLTRVVPHTRELTHRYGADGTCAGVHACHVPVLALETDPTAYITILAACGAALEEDGSDAIVLGCAGMADLCAKLSADLGVPVIDGVAAATLEVEKLVRLGLRTSKVGEFARPLAH